MKQLLKCTNETRFPKKRTVCILSIVQNDSIDWTPNKYFTVFEQRGTFDRNEKYKLLHQNKIDANGKLIETVLKIASEEAKGFTLSEVEAILKVRG